MKKTIITLTTDFGIDDAYVSSMKGIIKKINPLADIIDISHNIESYNILSVNYVFYSAYKYFPRQTLHIVVVDPGVGGNRNSLLIKTSDYYFFAPDNGSLTLALMDSPGFTAYNILQDKIKKIINSDISNTFHGRDVFAPAAALITTGLKINKIAVPAGKILLTDDFMMFKNGRKIKTKIVHIDKFGNVIINFKKSDLGKNKILEVEINKKKISDISDNYETIKKIAMVFGSMGFLEISKKRASASEFLGAKIGGYATLELRG